MTQKAKLGSRSLQRLGTCHPDWIRIIRRVEQISPIDFAVIEGKRSTPRQQELYAQGRSGPGRIVTHRDGVERRSKHQAVHIHTGEPVSDDHDDGVSDAIDVAPYEGKINWDDEFGFGVLYALILRIAKELGIEVRPGADWDSDGDRADQRFDDLPHFELVR